VFILGWHLNGEYKEAFTATIVEENSGFTLPTAFRMAGSMCSGQIFISRDIQVKGWFNPSTHINEDASITQRLHSFLSAKSIFHHLELAGENLLYRGKDRRTAVTYFKPIYCIM